MFAQVNLEDLYKGKTSKMALTKDIICPACEGIGGKKVSKGFVLQHGFCLLHQFSIIP